MDESGQTGQTVTMSRLAELAKVHVSTVSRALSDDPTGISAATVRRIQTLARQEGYLRNAEAAGLRTGQSRLIGVLVPRLTDVGMATVYDSIDTAAAQAGYSTVVANTHDDPALRRARLETLISRRLDGVIVGDSRLGDTAADDLQRRNVPHVLVMRRLEGHVSISADDRLGGQLAAEHLLQLGHLHVGVVAGDLRASTGRDRTEAFL